MSSGRDMIAVFECVPALNGYIYLSLKTLLYALNAVCSVVVLCVADVGDIRAEFDNFLVLHPTLSLTSPTLLGFLR
jgi:hypothetical protein